MNNLAVKQQQDFQDRGSMSMLIVGLVAVLLLIVSAVVGITSVYLEYKKLQDVADQAALAVAQEVRGLQETGRPGVVLKDATVQNLAGEFMVGTGASASLTQPALDTPTGVIDQDTAQVTIISQAKIPLLSQVVPASVKIRATGTAQTELSR